VVVHLNWVSIFLGFHAFGMYIHNDALLALGRESDQFGGLEIPIRPVIGLLGQALLGSEASVNGTTAYTGIRLTGTADLLVHHIHAFTIHVTASYRTSVDRSCGLRVHQSGWSWSKEFSSLVPAGW
jgi:photosystem I P700 chlorophyll a apoprotein A1